MMGAVHLLPGTTFSSAVQKSNYPSEKKACLTLPELERWLALQIAGVYHQSIHSALLKSPIQAWKDGLARRSRPPRYPSDRDQFFLDFLPGKPRLVRRDGIRLFNIHYWDSCLSPLSGRSNRPWMMKYDPRNLSRIYLQDESGKYWPIPYRDLGLPPIALWEHREAMKRLRAEGRRALDEKLIFSSVLEQRKILEASRKTVQQRRRSEQLKRTEESTSRSQATGRGTAAGQDYSHLPPFKVEEWP